MEYTPDFENDIPGSLILVTGNDPQGQPHYAYVTVLYDKMEAFLKAQQAGNLDVTQFGTVRADGPGLEPPEAVKQKMESEFGAIHDTTELAAALFAGDQKVNHNDINTYASRVKYTAHEEPYNSKT